MVTRHESNLETRDRREGGNCGDCDFQGLITGTRSRGNFNCRDTWRIAKVM